MGGKRGVSGRKQGTGEPRKLVRKQVCITLPDTLNDEVAEEINGLSDAWKKAMTPMPGRGGVMPKQRRSYKTPISTSEIIEWLLADWVQSQRDVRDAVRPKKIGAGIRPPPLKLLLKAEDARRAAAHPYQPLPRYVP